MKNIAENKKIKEIETEKPFVMEFCGDDLWEEVLKQKESNKDELKKLIQIK